MNQPDLFIARGRRDEGMRRAGKSARKIDPEWIEKAYKLLMYFAATHPEPWLSEDFRAWAAGKIPSPPEPRAWGVPVFRAAKRGAIVKQGYGIANSSNRSPKPLWLIKQ